MRPNVGKRNKCDCYFLSYYDLALYFKSVFVQYVILLLLTYNKMLGPGK